MFGILHSDGTGEDNPSIAHLPGLYDELLTADQEHGDVSVINDDSGWTISAHRDGRVIFEHLGEPGQERHMIPVSKDQVLRLWTKLIEGEIEAILSEPWLPGYR